MVFEITRSGKNSLTVETPVMPAAGTFGYGEVYRDMIDIEQLGALVTNPVTYEAWSPAVGTRVVALQGGVLVHTGLPNPGLSKVVKKHENLWSILPLPVILHLVGTTLEHLRRSARIIEETDAIDAVELGLSDDISPQDAERLVRALVENCEKPVIVRLPAQDIFELALAAADGGAGGLVVSAPPRGTARDPKTGRLVSGRVYGPLVKPITLRTVGLLARRLSDVPIIGAGGIHSTQDARDYLEAGARAVQVDSATWISPRLLEIIARDLGGATTTRPTGAFPDEWYLGMGDTEAASRGFQPGSDEKKPRLPH